MGEELTDSSSSPEAPSPVVLSGTAESWPRVRKITGDEYLIHLDQWVWVNLAKAHQTQNGEFWQLYQALDEAQKDGRVALALSATNYLELWNRRKTDSRARLAQVMGDLSGYVTLRAIHEVQREEIFRAAASLFSGTAYEPLDRLKTVGIGVNHAFGSEHGRLRFLESLATSESEEGDETEAPPEFLRLAREAPARTWEWVNLVGFDRDYSVPGIDYRPEYRLGDEWAKTRNSFDRYVESFGSDQSLLYRLLVARSLDGMGEMLVDAFETDQAILRFFQGPSDGVSFVGKVPTENVHVELQYRALKNKTYTFKQHDRGDVLDLALSMPYCDAVWPDAHWAHIVKAAKLDEMYGTTVIKNADDLIHRIDNRDR
jgi:hypothetical protein